MDRRKLIEDHLYLLKPVAMRLCDGLPKSFFWQDLAQEGYIGLVNAAETYDGQVKFTTWAIGKIRYAMLDFVRDWQGARVMENYVKLNRKMLTNRRAIRGGAASERPRLDSRDEADAVLARLTRTERLAMMLRYGESMKLDEIAPVIGCSRGNVTFIEQKAMRKLLDSH